MVFHLVEHFFVGCFVYVVTRGRFLLLLRHHERAFRNSAENISHELQTPLAIVKGNMEIVTGKKSGDRKAAVAAIASTLDAMSARIEGSLASARLNFSKEKLHISEFRVDALLEEVHNDLLVLAKDRGIFFSYSCREFSMFADRQKVKEVILNLASNAFKHTARGGSVALSGAMKRRMVAVKMADTGCGIPKEDIAHVFDRFYRIRGDAARGTGLGLDICRKIMEAHGGTITAESEPGKGACFTVMLPLKRIRYLL